MSILVTGATGQVGAAFISEMSDKVIAKPREALNLLDFDETRAILDLLKPDYVVHAAGYTDVQQAELHQKDLCWKLNTLATANLIDICAKNGSKLVLISCDRVFGGTYRVRFKETDPIHPTTVYGHSKAAAEHHLLRVGQDFSSDFYARGFGYWILRVGTVFEKPWRHGKNFVASLLSVAEARGREGVELICDTACSYMYATHLAKVISWIVKENNLPFGVYHVANSGHTSPFNFAEHLSGLNRRPLHVKPVSREEFSNKHGLPIGLFPKSRALSCEKFYDKYPEPVPTWQEALDEFVFESDRIKAVL